MQPFDDMDDAGFATFGEPATFTPAVGVSAACTVIVDRPIDGGGAGGLGQVKPLVVARLRKSEVAAPKEKDRITIAGTVYELKPPRLDGLGLVWFLDLRTAPPVDD
jgi:hypothetical protein